MINLCIILGTISITTEQKETGNDNNGHVQKLIVVGIKDTRKGIDEEIFPRLITKFDANSSHGVGLSLYISKHYRDTWRKDIKPRDFTPHLSGPLFMVPSPLAYDLKLNDNRSGIGVLDGDTVDL